MIESVVLYLILTVLVGYVLHLRKKQKETLEMVVNMSLLLYQITESQMRHSNIIAKHTANPSQINPEEFERLVQEFFEFQESMAEFAMYVTKFMEQIKAIKEGNTVNLFKKPKDEKLN